MAEYSPLKPAAQTRQPTMLERLQAQPSGGFDAKAAAGRYMNGTASGQAFDPAFGATCVDCQTRSPCTSLTGGSIKDFSDPSRVITWPAAGQPPKTKLLIIAKDVNGAYLNGKIRIEGQGANCKTGSQQCGRFRVSSRAMGPLLLTRARQDIEVGYLAPPSITMALKDYVPEQALWFMVIADAFLNLQGYVAGSEGASFTPQQCVPHAQMQQTLRVVPYPQLELAGDATVSVGLHFLTTGIGGKASIEGNLTGKMGATDISAAAKASAIASSGRAAPTAGTAPGFVGTIASIMTNFSSFLSQTSPSPTTVVDRTDYGSGVKFDMALKLTANGMKLEAKKASPDLEGKIGSLETKMTMTATGILDFVDLAAQILLSPAGARLVQEARVAIANKSNAVRGDVRAEVRVSASGELKHKIDSGLTIAIPANGPMAAAPEGLNTEFGGKLTVRGQAQILIHVEGEVWIASAEAGAAGTLHTGWNWEMKVDSAKKRKKRYYFEGLMARATGYVRIGVTTTAKRSAPSTSTVGTTSSRGVTMNQQGPQVSAGDSNWRDPNATRSELEGQGAVYVLIPPTVERITSAAPPWSDY